MKRLESLYVRQLKAKSIDKQKEMTTKKRLAGKRMSVTSTEGKRIGMKPKEKVNGRWDEWKDEEGNWIQYEKIDKCLKGFTSSSSLSSSTSSTSSVGQTYTLFVWLPLLYLPNIMDILCHWFPVSFLLLSCFSLFDSMSFSNFLLHTISTFSFPSSPIFLPLKEIERQGRRRKRRQEDNFSSPSK